MWTWRNSTFTCTAHLPYRCLSLIHGIVRSFALQTVKALGSGCKEVERKALLQFRQNLADPSGRLSSWVGEDCCRWRGVSCNNRTASVIKLKLNNPFRDSFDAYEDDAGHELGGPISPSLLQLKDLKYLDLSMNNFKGFKVPEFIGSLKELRYLNLSGSFFSGTIPQSLGNLSNLLSLDLNNFLDQSNQIGLGWISGLPSLKYLNLGGADLSKAAAYWLESISMLRSLVELHLPNCNLPILPIHFPSLNFTSLQVLDLSNNGFNSTIPHWLFNITRLSSLDLNTNDLQGDIPDGFASLNSLQQLDLSGNSFLGGRLSRNLGKLCNLRTLKLSRNNFSGELSAVEVLDLSENQWEGIITETHFRKLSNLKELSLHKQSENISLIFNISSHWIPPFKLTFINIRSSQLGPKFPTWLRNQTELTTLVLNNVRISDTIADWFWQLDLTLDELNVAYNELSGRIPNSLGFRFPGTVDLSSNSFEGPLPLWRDAGGAHKTYSFGNLELVTESFGGKNTNTDWKTGMAGIVRPIQKQAFWFYSSKHGFTYFQSLDDPSIYEGNLPLCGDPLPKRCSEIDGTPGDPGGDEYEEDENERDKLWLFVSMTLGFVVGFWGVCGTLIIKKSWR
ncbi:LRRNT 2 domain-containing protein [Citrus sinensis]|nr:LRRNT 2 domain-containing protein [Citrus sinensis]